MLKEKIREDLFPQTDEIFSWIEYLAGLGHRRSGSPENLKSARYIQGLLREFGMENAHIEEVPAVFYDPVEWHLKIEGKEIPTFFINRTFMHFEPGIYETGKIQGELVYVGDGSKEDFDQADVKGKIVIADLKWHDYSIDYFIREQSAGSGYLHDPRGTLPRGSQPMHKDTYTPNTFPYNLFEAMDRGALGYIGILVDNCDHYIHYNEDYTYLLDKEYPSRLKKADLSRDYDRIEIPGLWISRSSGEEIKALLEKGRVMGELYMKLRIHTGPVNNVMALLPGKSDETILIHSHHDSVFTGAVQDASGTSCMLALARYFSRIPLEQREKTLMFAVTDSHYAGYVGHWAFIKRRKEEGQKIIVDLVIEHIGKEAMQGRKGDMVLTGDVGFRLLYATENPHLLALSKQAVVDNDLERCLLLPVNREKGWVCSDGGKFFVSGYPVVSMISPVIYLMDPVDTLEMVAKDQLRPVSMAFAEIIYGVFGLSGKDLEESPGAGEAKGKEWV